MRKQSNLLLPVVVLAICIITFIAVRNVLADPPQSKNADALRQALSERVETGVRGPLTNWHYYWEDGYFSIDSRKEEIKLRINGQVIIDAGDIDADDKLNNAFPDLEGSDILFRKLSLSIIGNFYDTFDFEVGFDFSNIQDIQDIWIRYLRNSFLKKFKIGNLKEPFSLEYLTSISRVTFMERALPEEAFGRGHNIGIRYDRSNRDSRVNWGAGLFLNTGSFSNLGEAQDQIEQANGFDMAARVFGLPMYDENGKKMIHLGLGLCHGVRSQDDPDLLEIRTRPETRLTSDRLVDTGPIAREFINIANVELAMVSGPLSLQGQGYHTSLKVEDADNPNFWGYYGFVSYFITGEHRKYNRALGIFTGVVPQPSFHPLKGEWGAWELAFRHSHVDLNDGIIKGGKENNFTAGLNWYHNRNSRWMFNYINAYVKDRASPAIDNGRAHIFQARFQFIW